LSRNLLINNLRKTRVFFIWHTTVSAFDFRLAESKRAFRMHQSFSRLFNLFNI